MEFLNHTHLQELPLPTHTLSHTHESTQAHTLTRTHTHTYTHAHTSTQALKIAELSSK